MKIQIINHRHPLMSDVIILGKQNSKTLGLFPRDAYLDHAKKNFIFGAIENNTLLGFVLFRITYSKRIVFITQLCISDKHRGKGIAKLLLDQVKQKYCKLLNGIGLSCRKDYTNATKLWESFGFKAVAQIRSRSKEEKYLIKWYYDFGNADLFSGSSQASYKVNALLDANIIMKLSDEISESNQEATALFADWLTDEADFYYAPESFNEILRDPDLTRAQGTRNFLQTLKSIQFDPIARDTINSELLSIITGTSENDNSDRIQLAECITSNLEYFITLDKKLLDKSDIIFERYFVRILRPAEFLMFIDHNSKPNDYRSLRFAGANYEYCQATQIELNDLASSKWLNSAKNEKKHTLLDKLTKIVAEIQHSTIRLVKNNNNDCIAYFAATWESAILNVKVLRLIRLKISDVLFQQLIKDIMSLAKEKECFIVKIEEENLDENQHIILESFGFRQKKSIPTKLNIEGVHHFNNLLVNHLLVKDYIETTEIIKALENVKDEYKDLIKLSIEKQLFPVKLEDISIPVYIIPIKPYWASQLFDHHIANHSLFGSIPEISWNRENVYYRNVAPVSEIAPGRILWYVSSENKTKTGRESSIVACSYLEEVHIGSAKALYRKFKNYGIYEWKNILDLSKNQPDKEIKALKFIDTEVFKKPVSLSDVKKIFIQNGKPENTFASPVKVSSEIFNSVYKIANQL